MKSILALSLSLLFFFQSSVAGVSDAIKQLEKPSLEAAKEAVKSLDAISSDKNNSENKTAGALGRAIKKAFAAEFNVQQALVGFNKEIQNADETQRQGLRYLEPNSFGTVNNIAAEARFTAAREARSKAMKKFENANEALGRALDELSQVSGSSKLTAQDQEILKRAADAIKARTFEPSAAGVGEMRQLLVGLAAKSVKEYAAKQDEQQAKIADAGRQRLLEALQRKYDQAIRKGSSREIMLLAEAIRMFTGAPADPAADPAPNRDTAPGGAYITNITKQNNDSLLLGNDAVVTVTDKIPGLVKLNNKCVLFKDGPDSKIWIEDKETYTCDVVRVPQVGKPRDYSFVKVMKIAKGGATMTLLDGSILIADAIGEQVKISALLPPLDGLLLDSGELLILGVGISVKVAN